MTTRIFLIFTLAICWISCVQSVSAQESTNSSGGNATGVGGSISFSFGQVACTTFNTSTGSLAQGVQHAYEIVSVGVNESIFNISVKVFPNPTSNTLTINISEYNNEELLYSVFDVGGRLLLSEQIVASQTEIYMKNLPKATYFLSVSSSGSDNIQVFKIIKTH